MVNDFYWYLDKINTQTWEDRPGPTVIYWSLFRHSHYYKKINFFYLPYIKKISNLSIKETKMKFNKLSSDLNIKLLKGNKNFILYCKDYINKGKNLNKKTTDLSIKIR